MWREYFEGLSDLWSDDDRWSIVSTLRLASFCVGVGVMAGFALFSEDQWVPIVDSANLAFHEAGHLFYRVLGETMGWFGGTLGQLTFPVIATCVFWYRGHAGSFAATSAWFFQNMLNIARYMADARAQALPLVGGGEHDWTWMFSRLGVLQHDTQIAAMTRGIGWLGIVAVTVWLARRWWRDRTLGHVGKDILLG